MITSPKHKYGSCWIRDDKKLCYINIPRCASSSIKKAIQERGFKYSEKKVEGIPAFTVIREPHSRYVSGVIEYWKRTGPGRLLKEDKTKGLDSWTRNFEKIKILDEHTEKQISFLLPHITDIRWIITMENLKLLEQFGITLGEQQKKSEKKHVEIVSKNLPFDKKAIREFYKEDECLYNMWKKVSSIKVDVTNDEKT